MCARRKSSTMEWFGARSLVRILERWGPPSHDEPEARPPQQLYWDDGGDHGFICAGRYSAGFSARSSEFSSDAEDITEKLPVGEGDSTRH